MPKDIFNGLSRAELKRELGAIVAADQRSLPKRSKAFSAVARMQKFDMLPDVCPQADISSLASSGAKELYRGISSSSGIVGAVFARDLLYGPLFPGTQAAFGHGIYFSTATPGLSIAHQETFPSWSKTAHKYAKGESAGAIVRCALKAGAKIATASEMLQLLREHKSRAKDVFEDFGPIDRGTFAAALGFDALHCDDYQEFPEEETWLVLNRGALVFQNNGLQVAPPETKVPLP